MGGHAVKPFLAAIATGAVVFPWAYFGAQWSWAGSAVITVVWGAMAYAVAYVLTNPDPGVPR